MINGMTYGNITMKCASDLSDLIRTSFKSILTQLSEYSPSDSSVTAHLEMREGRFNANVEIHSQELNISTERSAESAVTLLGAIKHDLMEQIEAWKRVRTVEKTA